MIVTNDKQVSQVIDEQSHEDYHQKGNVSWKSAIHEDINISFEIEYTNIVLSRGT